VDLALLGGCHRDVGVALARRADVDEIDVLSDDDLPPSLADSSKPKRIRASSARAAFRSQITLRRGSTRGLKNATTWR
jgi:hypothetical protein